MLYFVKPEIWIWGSDPVAALLGPRLEQRAQPGRVEQLEAAEIDDDRRRVAGHGEPQRLGELGGAGDVQVAARQDPEVVAADLDVGLELVDHRGHASENRPEASPLRTACEALGKFAPAGSLPWL